MTIPELLELLRPYYVDWNGDASSLNLIAYSQVTKIAVPVDRVAEDGETPTTYSGEGEWLLGIDGHPLKDTPILPIAQVKVRSDGQIYGIEPHLTVSYQNVGPLLTAARHLAAIGDVL